MNKESLIRDIYKIVDLETGVFDIDAVAKKHNVRRMALEEFLVANEIISGGYGMQTRLNGNYHHEAQQMRKPPKK